MAAKEHWTCPYCNRDCTLGDNDIKWIQNDTYLAEDLGRITGNYKIYICPNPKCRKLAIIGHIFNMDRDANGNWKTTTTCYEWQLVPEANAKPYPDYIPAQLRNDYFEACLIKTKSPKASATLSRRCLQGIIRDYWGITKGRLIDEVNALQEKIDAQTWTAIDSVRKVGNIGAHMEKDVNTIIDVEPEEAGLLIWLIETLFEEWYIEKHEREAKMAKIIELAKSKTSPSPKPA